MNLYIFTTEEENIGANGSTILSSSIDKVINIFCQGSEYYSYEEGEKISDSHKFYILRIKYPNYHRNLVWYVDEFINPEPDKEYEF
jgi:hypothetical protein